MPGNSDLGHNWRRRLEGRSLEHGLVAHITGKPCGAVIRMLRQHGPHLIVEPITGEGAILRAMAKVAAKLCESLSEEAPFGWSFTKRGKAYADQCVRSGDARANIDLRLLDDAGGWAWVEVKWGDVAFHRTQKQQEFEKLQKIARASSSWRRVPPGGGEVGLERPRLLGYLIVSPTDGGFRWELYTAPIYGQVPATACAEADVRLGGALEVGEVSQRTPAKLAKLPKLTSAQFFARARGTTTHGSSYPLIPLPPPVSPVSASVLLVSLLALAPSEGVSFL